MEEGGVAHHTQDLSGIVLHFQRLGKTDGGRNAGAHADGVVEAVQRRMEAQGIAADVTHRDHMLQVLVHRKEEAAVGTAGAHGRRTGRRGSVRLIDLHIGRIHQGAADDLGVQLAYDGDLLFADGMGEAQGFYLGFQIGIIFLDDIKGIKPGGEFRDPLFGQGVGQSQLQVARVVPKDFPGMLVGNAGCDNANSRIGVTLLTVQGAFVGIFLHFDQHRFPVRVALDGHTGQHGILVWLPLIGLHRDIHPFAALHDALAVADPGGHTDHHGSIEPLGKFIGGDHVVLALLRVRRLHHGDLGMGCVIAVVLFILGAVTTGIIRGNEYKAAVHTGIAHCKNGVRRHIHTHVLKGAEGPRAADGSTGGNLKGNLLVAGPLGIDIRFIPFSDGFQNLRAGSSGIGSGNPAARLVYTPGNGLVAAHHYFFHGYLL